MKDGLGHHKKSLQNEATWEGDLGGKKNQTEHPWVRIG